DRRDQCPAVTRPVLHPHPVHRMQGYPKRSACRAAAWATPRGLLRRRPQARKRATRSSKSVVKLAMPTTVGLVFHMMTHCAREFVPVWTYPVPTKVVSSAPFGLSRNAVASCCPKLYVAAI